MSAGESEQARALYATIKAMMERARVTGLDMKEAITQAKRSFYEMTGAEGPERG